MVVVKYPDPTWVNKIGYVDDKDYITVKITKITTISNMHFIYLESLDNHVNMNLGTIVYTGDLEPCVKEGAVVKYMDNGNKLDFITCILQRDKDCKWVFQQKSVNQVLETVQSESKNTKICNVKSVKKEETKAKEKSKELYEVFDFYLEAFSILCHEDEKHTPKYKKAGIVKDTVVKCDGLRKLLFAVQTVLTTDLSEEQSKSVVIRNILLENGIMRLRNSVGFVKKMVLAWNCDVRKKIIDKNGVFLQNPEQSSILALELLGYVPNTEKTVLKKIKKAIDKREFDRVVNNFDAARIVRRKRIMGRPKTL